MRKGQELHLMKNPELTIRPAREADMDAILEIEKQGDGTWKREFFLSELKNPRSHFMVAEDASVIAGFAVVWRIGPELQLNNIGVHIERRRAGIGGRLLEYIISLPSETAPDAVILEVRERNTGAREFYSRLGFTATGMRKNYYGDDNAILMEKKLNEI
jgi:ribosomal-protein-alanine N-acetyltransferase